jgi:hypothetical protein
MTFTLERWTAPHLKEKIVFIEGSGAERMSGEGGWRNVT